MELKSIFNLLEEKSNKDKATQGKKYMKSNLEFFGISNPELRNIAKQIYKNNKQIPYDLIEKLWKSKNFEAMYVALYLLELYKKIYDEKIWKTVNDMVEEIENWAHCDQLCNLRSEFWERKDFLGELSEWSKSENLWKRRSAAVSLLVRRPMRIPFTFKQAMEILDPILHDEEYFVQKGVGWMLRVLYQQYPKQTFDYLLEHRDGPRVALRTACEKMSDKERKQVLFSGI